jgi:hypothetical protein
MFRLVLAAFVAALCAIQFSPARADDVPRLNIEKVCSDIAKAAGQSGDVRDREACLRTERDSHTALARQWSEFPAADRSSCYSLTPMGVGGTYSELLTCLEMSRDVRKLHNSEGTVGSGRRR